MVNEQDNLQETEHVDIGRLIGTLKRVEAPKDFDFHVRARIAKGRPTENRSAWLPASVRFAAPLGLLLAVGGYVGFSTMYSPSELSVPVIAYTPAESAPQPVVPPTDLVTVPAVIDPSPQDQTLAGAKQPDSSNRVNKTAQRTPVTTNTKTEKPGGGSYDIGGQGERTIRQPDVDDNEAPPPSKKVIVPASQFLNSVGISSSGGKITSVSGAAASAGLRAGDVIEAVNVQAGMVRVTRDGKSITVTIK